MQIHRRNPDTAYKYAPPEPRQLFAMERIRATDLSPGPHITESVTAQSIDNLIDKLSATVFRCVCRRLSRKRQARGSAGQGQRESSPRHGFFGDSGLLDNCSVLNP